MSRICGSQGGNVVAKIMDFTAVEAARKLGISLDYIYRMLLTGKLQGQKLGKQWRVPAAAVEAALKQRGR
jgi:excisionase family DNA binding protein